MAEQRLHVVLAAGQVRSALVARLASLDVSIRAINGRAERLGALLVGRENLCGYGPTDAVTSPPSGCRISCSRRCGH